MIPTELRSGLKKRLEKLFEHETFKAPKNTRKPLSFFEQKLPKKTKADDEFYPLVIIKLIDGEQKSDNDDYKIYVHFIIGIYDNGMENQGCDDVTHIINKIVKSLYEYPLIDQFEFSSPFRWGLIEEDTEPYYFGAIEATFIAPVPVRQPPEEARDFL